MHHFWRFASPSTLLLALLLFPLPWIEIQCRDIMKRTNPLTKLGVPDKLAEALVPPEKLGTLYTQSGWQAVRGDWSRDAQWSRELQSEDAAKQAYWGRFESELTAAMRGSWIMAVYAAVLLAGVLAGILLQRRRGMVVALLAGCALALVGMQFRQEFPLTQAFRHLAWERVDPNEPPPTAEEIEKNIAFLFRYTAWFWLAQIATIGCLLLLAAEWYVVHRKARRVAQQAALAGEPFWPGSVSSS